MILPHERFESEEIIAAAANPARSRQRARTLTRRHKRTQLRLDEQRRAAHHADGLAELAARVTHIIDGVPLEIVAGSREDGAIEIHNLADRTRWAIYAPRGAVYRLFPARYGDCGMTPTSDFDCPGKAEGAAIDWVLGRG